MTKDLLNELEVLFRDFTVPARGRGRRFPAPVKARLISMMQSGVSAHDLSKASGISMTTLSSWKKRSHTKHFSKIELTEILPPSDKKLRLYIADKAWIEIDETAISTGILQRIKAAL